VYRIHNQSTILKDSDWTSSRAKEFIWSLKHLEELSLKNCVWRMHLKKRFWRRAPEDTSSEARTSEALVIRSISRQKLLHQSWQRTLYEVYDHDLCNHLLCNLCRCNKTKITVILLQTMFLLFWSGFELSSSYDNYQIRQNIKGEESKLQSKTRWCNG